MLTPSPFAGGGHKSGRAAFIASASFGYSPSMRFAQRGRRTCAGCTNE